MTAESFYEITGVCKCVSVYSSQFLLTVSCQQFIIGNKLKVSRVERTLGQKDWIFPSFFFLPIFFFPLPSPFKKNIIFLETE